MTNKTTIRKIVLWHVDTGKWSAWLLDVYSEGEPSERKELDEETARRMIALGLGASASVA